jgi:diacylglycerol kinase (ATP)
MNPNYFVIINPASCGWKSEKNLEHIYSSLRDAGIRFTSVLTQSKNHAYTLTQEALMRGERSIICVGGDGTMNEVVNGIFSQGVVPTKEITLGMIPTGMGKDWGKTIGIPDDREKAVLVLKRRETFLQDVGVVQYYLSGRSYIRYFANVAGMGYDAYVTDRVNIMKNKGKSGLIPYLSNLLTCLMRYQLRNVSVSIDGKVITTPLFSMNVGICKFSGGGMKQVPSAIPDDGFFDVTMIKDVGKLDVLKNVRNLYDGSFIQHPKISTYRGKIIEITSHPELYLEVDGESLGHTPLRFDIIPQSLTVLVDMNMQKKGRER